MRPIQAFTLLVLVAFAGDLRAAESPEQAIQEHLIPPEVLLQHQQELGLSDEQLTRIRSHLEQVQADVAQAQQKLEPSTRKLAELISADLIDETAVLKQLDELIDAERVMRRLHMRVMVRVRNELTEKQLVQAVKLQRTQPGNELRQRLDSKMARIQKEVQRRAEGGQPPLEVIELMQSLPEQLKQGRYKEVEATLDRALKMLDLEKDVKDVTQPKSANESKSATDGTRN